MNWQEQAIARVKTHHDPEPPLHKRRGPRDERLYRSEFARQLFRVHLHTTLPMVRLLDRAARVKGVNRSTFVRRSVAVQVAAALAMDITEVLYVSPGEGPYGGHQTDRGSRDTGAGIEAWCPHPGCDGSHLRSGGGRYD